eukprot:2689269-Pyramimonas_sp.AAC.1
MAARARGRGPAVRVSLFRWEPLQSAKKVELEMCSKRCTMDVLMDQHSLHQWPSCAVTRGSCSYAASQSAFAASRHSATVVVA